MSAELRRARLGAEIRRSAPEEPGVYFFLGEKGEILYVGKAVNLRRRLLSHLRPMPREEGPRHSRLAHASQSFTCELIPSELQALVREDELIKLHRPLFNVRQNDFLEYRYLERTEEAFPRFCLADHEADFGVRRIFGPYRDIHAAERLMRFLQRVFGVRSCTTPDPVGRCLELPLGHCAGPCRPGAGADVVAYAREIERAEAFLRGDPTEAEDRIRRSMEAAASRLEFEKAQEMKEQLLFCRRFAERARFLTAFREQRLTVSEGGRTHTFLRGRVVEPAGQPPRAPALEPPREAAGDFADVRRDRRFVHDRAVVVHGWLRRHRDRCRYWFDEA